MALGPGSIERFCSLIREWFRLEHEQAPQGSSPAAAAIGAEIADLESLIDERPARAATLRTTIEDLRQKQVNLQRAAWRRKSAPEVALPAEEAYRAAVADMNGALIGHNIEAARAALRGLLGEIPVFQEGRHLAARLTINATSLLRNPDTVLLIGSGAWSGKDEPLLVHPPLRTVHVSFPTYGSSLTKALSKDPAARPAILLEGVKPWHPI